MAHNKKSTFILVTAFTFMALISTGCERSYAPIDSLATPTVEGGEFPQELPSDMEGVFEAGAKTATAQAAESAAPAAEDPTATPEAEDAELTDDETSAEETSSDDATEEPTEEAAPPTATHTPQPSEEPTEAPTQEPVDTNNLPTSYTLKKGEFPYCIARRYNVDPGELLSMNGISTAAASALQPGLTLKIPQTGNPFPYDRARNVHPVTYIVPATNTVYGIACYFGDVDPQAILNKNSSITDPYSVPAGTSLQIP